MPSRPKDRYRIFEARPLAGGNLVTRGSSDNAGIFNYQIKRDVRRDLDVEIRREGIDYFVPNLTLNQGVPALNPPYSGQPFPSQILLSSLTFAAGVATATRLQGQWFENGEQVIITGASDPNYNGTFTISNATRTTFSYVPLAAPAVSPDPSTAITAQAIEAINLIAMARRPNGKTAVIAGSARRLYRYYALEDQDYISHDPADYPAGTATNQLSYWSDGYRYPADAAAYPPGTQIRQQEYVDEIDVGAWIVIGSGFSPNGKRWEVVNINGYMVFNNSVDLLQTYRVEDLSVIPIYELREQGIASVGTISEVDGLLCCGDIAEIKNLTAWFKTAGQISVNTLTFNIMTGKATGTISAGHSFLPGDRITVSGAVHSEYDGDFIVDSVTPTTFTYAIIGTPATPDPSAFIFVSFTNNVGPYSAYTDEGGLDRTIFRFLWGTPGEPRRWAPVYRGAMTAGSNVVSLAYHVQGLAIGQNITVSGAGTPHAGGTSDDLTGNIIFINGANIVLDSFAQTTTGPTNVIASDAIGSIVGYEDLQDDGSAILKAIPFADQLVIFKDTSVFIAQYLGNVAQPFAFSPRRIQKEQSLYYRNTLALAETPTEMFLIYAGRNSFYRFDLTNQQPMILPHFESCSDIFYNQAKLSNTEQIFVFENGITHELNFVFPSFVDDQMLCWDYKQDTLSTSSVVVTAGATIRKPITGLADGAERDWCVLGNGQGTVMLYGLVNEVEMMPNWNTKQIFFRREASPLNLSKGGYPSYLRSGLGNFGNPSSEKDVRFLLALFASQDPNTAFTFSLYGTQNANLPVTLLGAKVYSNPEVQNLLPVAFRRFLFQSELGLTGVDNPCRIVGIDWSVSAVDSRSTSRA